jgi:hypothetical protein
MTKEQARERAVRAYCYGTKRAGEPEFVIRNISRELLLAQAEAYEGAAQKLREKAAELDRQGLVSYHKSAVKHLKAQAHGLDIEAAELRRTAEEIACR